MPLQGIQFSPRLLLLESNFRKYETSKELWGVVVTADPSLKLPAYSFVEPRFTPEPGLLKTNYP